MKRMVSILLVFGLLVGVFCCADVSAEESQWRLINVILDHKTASFRIDDANMAQDAFFCVSKEKDGEKIIYLPITITNSREDFELNFPEGVSLAAGKYFAWVENMGGEKTPFYSVNFREHFIYISGLKAYQNCVKGYDEKKMAARIYAEVGFEKYDAQIQEDGHFTISYPTQKIGNGVKVYMEDAYGCKKESSLSVENKHIYVPSLDVSRGGVFFLGTLEEDERFCAEVDGKIYYSKYGAGDKKIESMVVEFPNTGIPRDIREIPIWIESTVGSSTEKKLYQVTDCIFGDTIYMGAYFSVYPEKAKGSFPANSLYQMPTTVSVTVGGKLYSAEIKGGVFSLSYPVQKEYTELEFIFQDEHGCQFAMRRSVSNRLSVDDFNVIQVLPNKFEVESVPKGARVYVKVEGKVYVSRESINEFEDVITVSYPNQKPGTRIMAWLQDDDSAQSSKKTFTIENKKYVCRCLAETDGISGEIYLDPDSSNENNLNNIRSVAVIIDNKSFNCWLEERNGSDYSDRELEKMGIYDDSATFCHFEASFPKQKLGKAIQLRAEDEDGCVFTRNVVLENYAPKIKVNAVYSNDTKISGTTKANSQVTVQYGKKTYRTKSKSNGKFTVKVKAQKSGTKIKVSVVTPKGYHNFVTAKTKLPYGAVFINKTVYRTSSSISVTVRKPRKGDKLIVKAAGRTYTKTIKGNKSKQKIVMKLRKKPSAGSKVSVILKDKFGKKKDWEKVMAYYSNAIVKGMSASNAALTTWGRPIRKNDYGTGSIQWVFQSGNSYLYAYIKGGKVIAIQRLNY